MSDLKISCFNANGLVLRKDEISNYVIDNDFDIMLISETHLAKGQHYPGKPQNYSFFRADHPSDTCRGGAGLLIKNSIRFSFDPKFTVTSESIQAVGVTVATNTGNVFVAAVYCPPNCPDTNQECFSRFFQGVPHRFIIGGDWNAKHRSFGCRLTTTKGRHLRASLIETGGTAVSDGFPTHYPTDTSKQPDILDFFVVRGLSRNYLAVGSELEMTSDHIPIQLVLHQFVILKTSNYVTNAHTNWDYYRQLLNSSISGNPIDSVDRLETEAESIANLIISAASDSTPVIKYTKSQYGLPSELRNLIKLRRRLRAKWHNSRHYADRSNFNRISRITTSKISEFRESKTFRFLQNLTPFENTNYSLYKATKYLKKTQSFSEPLQRPDGSWTKTNQEKTNEFSRHLAQVFRPHQDIQSDIDVEAEKLEINPSPPDYLAPISREEVADMIRYKIKERKAPGMDLVTGEMLKQLPRKAMKRLADIFSAALELRWVPSVWKKAEVILIPKSGKPTQLASSYRPISLLSIIGKLFERLYLKRLQPIINERKIIPDHQFGFRKQHSTVEQIHRLVDLINKSMDAGIVCSIAFLDIAQAFDRVWLEGLALKIYKLLPLNHFEILTSYLNGRSFRVRYEECFSDFLSILAGVPQGSVLGPVLFLLYMYDFPKIKGTRLTKFADDTAISAIGSCQKQANVHLQKALNAAGKFCKDWRTKINTSKSQHCTYSLLNSKKYSPVFLDGNSIPPVESANYLGMHLDTKLTFGKHVLNKRNQVNKKYLRMYWMLRHGSGVSLRNKLTLYNAILKPIWMYGSQLWGSAAPTHIKSIQTLQNKILRGISGVKWDDYIESDVIHRILGVPSVEDSIRKLTFSYANRLASHPNDKAYKLLDSYRDSVRRLKKRRPLDNVAHLLDF